MDYFRGKVQIGEPEECWPWLASCVDAGYGAWWSNGKIHNAHRMAFRLFKGEPAGQVNHACGNPRCCNPAHLYDGSQAENMADAVEHGTFSPPPPPERGSRNGQARLREEQVLEIKRQLASGRPKIHIARDYGVSRRTIDFIKTGKNWGWLI